MTCGAGRFQSIPGWRLACRIGRRGFLEANSRNRILAMARFPLLFFCLTANGTGLLPDTSALSSYLYLSGGILSFGQRRGLGKPGLRASPRSQIAICRQNKTVRSRQTRGKAIRQHIKKLARYLSWVPPLFAVLLRCRRICRIAGQDKSISCDERRIDLEQYCDAKAATVDRAAVKRTPTQRRRLVIRCCGQRRIRQQHRPTLVGRWNLTQIKELSSSAAYSFLSRTNGGVT